jgi:predicted phosphodiesterase
LTSSTSEPIKIVCVSDTHNTHPSLPCGDLLVHAGDLTIGGSFDELQAQLDWINTQSYRYKIVIAGNHDLLLDPTFVDDHPTRVEEMAGRNRADLSWGDIIYLENTSTCLEFGSRQLNIYGSPWTPQFGTWAFQHPPIRDVWSNTIPMETDIVVTHGPPIFHLDMDGKGCEYLLKELRRIRPMATVFGHIHAGYGQETLSFDGVQEAWEKVLLGSTKVKHLLKMALRIIWPQGSSKNGGTKLVNAAVLREQQTGGLREPVVFEL